MPRCVRSVKLKRGDGVVTHHSINHLYPLELSLTHNPHFRNSDSTQTEIDVIPRDIIRDMSSGDDSVNQSQTASGDLSRSHLSNSVDSRRPHCAAVVAVCERVQSWRKN